MIPLIAWVIFGSGAFLAVCGVKNRNPRDTLISLLKTGTIPDTIWYPLPSDIAGTIGGDIGSISAKYAQEIGQVVGGSSNTTGNIQPQGSARQIVLGYAQAQLGEPYSFGASGPDKWDCSGLTMRAYEQVGIKLPHHAASQQQVGTAVSKANAQPGDLVFWGVPSGHVAIWMGNDTVIHAPHRGDVVKISKLWSPKTARFRSYL